MKKLLLFLFTHVIAAAIGFAAGIYVLPILIAPPGPTTAELQQAAERTRYIGEFRRDLPGSDLLHWGEGVVTVGPQTVTLMGRLAPGPDYKLYLSPEFVQTKAEFERMRPRMRRIGDVRTFQNFSVELPPDIDLAAYNTVVVWCEAFSMFITAARYEARPEAAIAAPAAAPAR